MPAGNQISEFTVTGERVPFLGNPFAMDSFGLTDYLGGLSLNEYAAAREAAMPGAIPLIPDLLEPITVTGARIATKVLTELTPLGWALWLMQPSPTVTQEQETAQLEAYWAAREAARDVSQALPPAKPAPVIPPQTVSPEVVQLPEVTVSPPATKLRPIGGFPLFSLPAPDLPGFEDQPIDIPTPEIIPIPEREVTFPIPAAPSRGGSVPIGLPLPGGSVGIRPRDTVPTEVPVFDAASPSPLGDPVFFPLIPPEVADVPRARPAPEPNIDIDLAPRFDTAADSAAGGTRVTSPAGPRVNVGTAPDVALPGDLADSIFGPQFFAPLAPGRSSPSPSPFPLPEPFPLDLAQSQPVPRLAYDYDTNCDCSKAKEKRKQRKPRAQCFKGTYVQRAKTTVFVPREEVDCNAPPPKVSTRGPGARKKRLPTKWKDIVNDVFYPKP